MKNDNVSAKFTRGLFSPMWQIRHAKGNTKHTYDREKNKPQHVHMW